MLYIMVVVNLIVYQADIIIYVAYLITAKLHWWIVITDLISQ